MLPPCGVPRRLPRLVSFPTKFSLPLPHTCALLQTRDPLTSSWLAPHFAQAVPSAWNSFLSCPHCHLLVACLFHTQEGSKSPGGLL